MIFFHPPFAPAAAIMGIGNSSHDSDSDASRDEEDERRPIPPKHILSPVGSPEYIGNVLDSSNQRKREGMYDVPSWSFLRIFWLLLELSSWFRALHSLLLLNFRQTRGDLEAILSIVLFGSKSYRIL
jgi:hypothetical protein